MNKILSILGLIVFGFTFSQVTVTPESKDLDTVYKGGNKQLIKDVQDNFRVFSSDYQVNGKFIITFDLDKDGKIIHPKVLPEVSDDFGFALIRSFKRVKNNFNTHMPTTKLAVLLDFNQTFKNSDDRDRFNDSSMSGAFSGRP